jgi:hypothetical protein
VWLCVVCSQPSIHPSIDGLQLVARGALLRPPAAAAGCKHLRMRTALQAIAHLYGHFGPLVNVCRDCSVLLAKVHPLYLPLSQFRFPIIFRKSMDFTSNNQAVAKCRPAPTNSMNDQPASKGKKKIICRCGKPFDCRCGPDYPMYPIQTQPSK